MAYIPDLGQVLQRYYGYYANRTRGERRKAEAAAHAAESGDEAEATPTDTELSLGGVNIVEPADFSRSDARRRWAELIRLIYEVDPLVCPKCGGTTRVISPNQEPNAIDKMEWLTRSGVAGVDSGSGIEFPIPGKAHVVGNVFRPEKYGIALPPDSSMQRPLNGAILQMYQDGSYDELYEWWFGSGGVPGG